MTEAQKETVRMATPAELGLAIRMLREMRKWSQETLSALSGLSVRTVQRVENGEPSSVDTRRALARVFDSDDIDVFNKPYSVPTMEELKAEKEKIDRENTTIACNVVTSGRELLSMCVDAGADHSSPATHLEDEAAEIFASLIDYLRDWRDCWDVLKEVDKLDVYRETQGYLDSLSAAGISVVAATRKVKLTLPQWESQAPMPMTVLYLIAFEKGKEPKELWVPRQIKFAG